MRRRALDPSGALGAAGIGSVIYLAGSWRWSAILLAFFSSSTALSRLDTARVPGVEVENSTSEGPRRNIAQTLANGGIGGAAALLYLLRPASAITAAFTGAVAAANADTWATEIGGASTSTPRMIHTGKIVPAGTSGAVTAQGLLAAAGGSMFIALVSAAAIPEERRLRCIVATGIAGICGTLADSLAGALVQVRYRCPNCETLTEMREHRCGVTTTYQYGWRWCSNDVVNVICTTVGAGVSILLAGDGRPT